MNRIENTFLQLKKKHAKGLIVFLTAGYPDLQTTERLIHVLIDSGADAVEIGIPFSDPIADGPVIQMSSEKALEQGITLPRVLQWIQKIRKRVAVPILCMGYANPFARFGYARLMHANKGIIDGLIIPDLSLEESGEVRFLSRKNNMHLIQLISPITPEVRRDRILRVSSGFIYAVSTTGVTGARKTVPKKTISFLSRLRSRTSIPIAVGIGISSPLQIKAVKRYVDAVIVGSAYIELIRKYKGKKLDSEIRKYTNKLKKAL
ncbi:MAG: tryptophan synthase subunit alpha [bacterium]